MSRPKRTVSKKKAYKEEVSESTSDSDSDFDEDEDPDKIEVPGGGKDLVTAVTSVSAHKDGPASVKKEDPDIQMVSSTSASGNAGNSKLGPAQVAVPPALKGGTSLLKRNFPPMPGVKGPGGLVTKSNPLGFETIRPVGGVSMPPYPNPLSNFLPGVVPGVAGNASGGAMIPPGLLNTPFFQCEYGSLASVLCCG